MWRTEGGDVLIVSATPEPGNFPVNLDPREPIYRYNLAVTFVAAGRLAICSQSGAIGIALLSRLHRHSAEPGDAGDTDDPVRRRYPR